jgi:hypothetical protein
VKSKLTQSNIVKPKQNKSKQLKKKATTSIQSSPQPGPSHIYVSEDSESELTDTDDENILEAERCCVYKQFTPDPIRNGVAFEIICWVQCENNLCKHWVHLKYCTDIHVAPVTNLHLGRATTQSHSSQWSKKKVAVET